ncbi:SAM-dependent methyltransferase [Pelagibacteraceae bacterium]|nr:SAM-dependent methyltransferase [Pelagibacteraceae bacterium]
MLIEPKDKILNIIDKQGYINLDEFIDLSLNKLELSYYKSENPLGKDGDFITAPEISQLYGEIIGLFIANHIKENHLKKFNLIELGPGKGTLMNDVNRVLSTIFGNKIHYGIHFVEINKNYQINLRELFSDCSIHLSVDTLPKKNSIILANEFFDAFPIIQAQKIDNKLYETIITKDSGKLIFDKKEIRNEYEELFDLDKFPSNQIIEKSPTANLLFETIVNHLLKNKGMMIVIDYGYMSVQNGSTLQSIKNNKKTNFLDSIGKQDLTSNVNFNELLKILDKNKIKNKFIQTQREFLISNGINYRAEALIKKNKEKENEILNQVSRLIDIDKMGTLFKFLQFSCN